MKRALYAEAPDYDIVHSHGLWMMTNVYPTAAANLAKRPIIVSPRGTLNPIALKRSRIAKVLFWQLLQKRAVENAFCLHATSSQECDDIRRAGIKLPVAIIPNGIALPGIIRTPDQRVDDRVVVYIGRLHPIKNLAALVTAWRSIQNDFGRWTLQIIGPSDGGHGESLQQLAIGIGAERIEVRGPLYGATKWAKLRAAKLFVMPSLTENFGMSIAEAMATGLPVLTTTGTPWAEAVQRRCGWHVEPNAASLANALRTAMSLDLEELAAMGERGKQWMIDDFSWRSVALRMHELYHWARHGGQTPDSVQFAD